MLSRVFSRFDRPRSLAVIVISASLPKSGSTFLFQLTRTLLGETGQLASDAAAARAGLKPGVGRRPLELSMVTLTSLGRLRAGAAGRGSLVAKTHAPPTRRAQKFMRLAGLHATYIYRDPRDVVLSLRDHRAKHDPVELATAIATTRSMLEHWAAWRATPNTLALRYEELTRDPAATLASVADHLGLCVEGETIARVVAACAPKPANAAAAWSETLFNKGCAGRFRDEMTDPELAEANHAFEPWLNTMGYAA